MAVRDEDFGSGLTLVEGDDGIWSSPEAAPACALRDWRSECEREHARAERERARAEAAEARCEELRWAEVESRARAGSLKWQLDRSRSKLKAAVEETQEVRRTAKDALSLQAEVTRLEKLLSEASIEPAKHRPTSPADKAKRRLRATLEQAENQKATIESLRAERGELRKEVTRLNRELARLGKRLAREEQASERHKETIRRQYDEDIQHRAALRRLRDQSDRVRSLTEEVFWLRIALDGAKAGREALKAQLVKLRAVGATLSKLPSDEAAHLRVALRKSRRQKTTINVLSKENARLRRAVKGSRTRREASDALLAKLRATGKSLSKSLRGADAELRRALRRSRRQKATIRSLSRENARLRKRAKASRNRIETLEVQLARLRATGAVLSRALFGRKSEKQEPPRSARPAARRPRPWPYPTARARGAHRRDQTAGGGACVLLLREGLCRQRCRRIHPRRDRGQGLQTRHPAPPVAPGLRLRVVADRSVGAPGAAAVPQNALRDQLLGALPVRTLRLLPPPAPGCRVDVRPGAADLTGDAGQQPEALRAAVRAGGRGDPRAPERGGAAPCRRDRLGAPG